MNRGKNTCIVDRYQTVNLQSSASESSTLVSHLMSQHPSLLASDGGGYEKVGSCHPNNLGKEIFSIVLSNVIVLKNVQTGKEDCFYIETVF